MEEELYREFLKNYNEYIVLKNAGIFDMRNGSMEIHYDTNGIVRKIEEHRVKFKI